MPKYWMISNRAVKDGRPSGDLGNLRYWVAEEGPLSDLGQWTEKSHSEFTGLLVAEAGQLPEGFRDSFETNWRLTFFIHGQSEWSAAAQRYQRFCDSADRPGLCVSFDWPSQNPAVDYLPDREFARECAYDLADVLSELVKLMAARRAVSGPKAVSAAKSKDLAISESRPHCLLQRAIVKAWPRKKEPLLVSFINQLYMIMTEDVEEGSPTGATKRSYSLAF